MDWRSLTISPTELCLARVLRCGQTFRWKNIHDVWTFATKDGVVLLKQDEKAIHYSQVTKDNEIKKEDKIKVEADSQADLAFSKTKAFIDDYFGLHINLENLYSHWISKHAPYMKKTASPFELFPGVRQLRQDPWETVVSFICSSNNNVKRISKMCDSLCTEFGDYVGEYAGIKYYSFPLPEVLAEPHVEGRLRQLGFGYRAKYIYQTAVKFTSPDFPHITMERLIGMRDKEHDEAHEFLLELSGVGPKVADCICLMALDKHDTVPVDTHVYQIATRDYKFKGKKDLKLMNKEMYSAIREFFKDLFGEYAGWAQTVLFALDLSDLNNGVNIKEEVKSSASEPTKIKATVEKKVTLKNENIDMKVEATVKSENGFAGGLGTKRIRVK